MAVGWGLVQGDCGKTHSFLRKQCKLGTMWKMTLLPIKKPTIGRGEWQAQGGIVVNMVSDVVLVMSDVGREVQKFVLSYKLGS